MSNAAPETPSVATVATDRREVRRVLLSSYLGSTIEFYDFLLYATASSLVFGAVFFANLDPLTATIASFGTFAAGYVARPLGGFIFGHFGDRLGRKKMLVLTMSLMGIGSTLIGLIPTPAVIGALAPILLILLRVCQGIAVGGEWGGAALMALEHAASGRRGFAASFANAGAPSGAVLGTLILGLFAALPTDQFLAWGWRVPFLLSVVLLAVGLYVRSRISESPVFKAAMAQAERNEAERPAVPLFSVLRRPKALILTALGAAAGFAFQVTMATFAVTYAVAAGAERQGTLFAFSAASFISIFVVIGAGRLSDRVGRKPMIVGGLVLFILYLFPFFALVGSANPVLIFLGFTIGLFLHSCLYGPLAAFVSEQFGTASRYTGASGGYQLATLLGGGFTPGILASLYASSQRSIVPVVVFLAVVGVVSLVAVLFTRESRDLDLTTVEH
ncbi:MFS transporter [Tersicoccus sp. Bi-70]|uniref:MFS transporter n=1 Tax=Tersicoccus sp. Bi-70 TaxID=1897634 RepID=UPI00097673AA|nr:MFS transporter [Tersicoccus sp. Bi-70]OMH32355.1 MFS transporter [Tersicoccus sp. Bi-70]